jgi:hypothetical protein
VAKSGDWNLGALMFAPGEHRMGWADDARPLWIEAYDALTADRPGMFGAVTARAEVFRPTAPPGYRPVCRGTRSPGPAPNESKGVTMKVSDTSPTNGGGQFDSRSGPLRSSISPRVRERLEMVSKPPRWIGASDE